MHDLKRLVQQIESTTQPMVMATVVHVEGSAYRSMGARMLVLPPQLSDEEEPSPSAQAERPSLRICGSISGGCLEQDIALQAAQVFETGEPRLIAYDSRSEQEDMLWGMKLGCKGLSEVLLELVDFSLPHIRLLSRALHEGKTGVLVTCTSNDELLARHIVFEGSDDNALHLVANDITDADYDEDWCAELTTTLTRLAQEQSSAYHAHNHAQSAGAAGAAGAEAAEHAHLPRSRFVQARSLKVEHAGKTVRVLVEVVMPPQHIVIFGAGFDAQPVADIASMLGWHVTVVDYRAEYVTAERFPCADKLVFEPTGAFFEDFSLPADAVVLVMTHHYERDREIVRYIVGQMQTARSVVYLGLLGSQERSHRLLRELASEGVHLPPEQAHRVFAPIGLDIGSETAEEIALAVIAEIQAVLNGRTGGFLRARTRDEALGERSVHS